MLATDDATDYEADIIPDMGVSRDSPTNAVPSALTDLTSLFGMVRGEPRRNNHLKSYIGNITYSISLFYSAIF